MVESVNVYNFVHLVEVKVDSCSYFTYGANTFEHFEKKKRILIMKFDIENKHISCLTVIICRNVCVWTNDILYF